MARITKPMMDRTPDDDGDDLAYKYRRIIGRRVRELRLKADMTQRELGDLVTIGETGISALELGRSSVSPERYEEFATIFDLDREEWGKWLLRYTDPYLYALIFGLKNNPDLKADLTRLNSATRLNRKRGPRH